MESDLGHRLSKLEGITTGYKFALATVSAVLIGGMGILVTIMFAVRSDVADLRERVNALPGEINQNLLELNQTLSESITAARSSSEAPQVIVIERATEISPEASDQ